MAPDLDLLRKEFDYRAKEERRKTGNVGRKEFGSRPSCALCGRRGVHFAHLVPLEEGGSTEPDNLIPLCDRPVKACSCHWLYDRRYASIAEMDSVRRSRTGARELAKLMRYRLEEHKRESTATGEPDPKGLQSLIARGHNRKCARKARKAAASAGLGTRQGISYSIREIECERRRTARGALDSADRRYAEIAADAQAYPDLLPRLYYERGYVLLLQGRHRAAKRMFENSAACAEQVDGGSSIEYWVAESSAVECTIAVDGVDSPWSELLVVADRAQEVLRSIDRIHANRWVDNWNWDRIRIALIRGDAEGARKLLSRAESHMRNQTALGGWSTGSLAKRLGLRGSVTLLNASSESDKRAAAEWLTRSVVVLVGRGRQYPEGLRDTLYDLAAAVERLTIPRHDELPSRLRAIAERTRDGSSWSHPYRDPDD